MCGILGYSHISSALPTGVLTSALNSIAHRGPDHEGRFVSNHISLGATRLRIRDLEAGDQPLSSPDGNVVVIFNGEIFNHHEIRAELEVDGFSFRTNCDTEVVLQAFLRWGSTCFSRFRGMFAIAVWVQSEQRLILARDRIGIKPLYYCLHENEIYFGSEMKVIFAHPGVSRKISLVGLNCYLSLNYVPGPHTMVEGIAKLMPGHILVWQNGLFTLDSMELPAATTPPASLNEACKQLDELLTGAVVEQLRSDVPLGLWLSGGLDSTTVLHYATHAHARRIQTFSITFQGRSFDESRYIREVSSRYGTEHSELDLNPSADLERAIEEIAFYSDEPNGDAGAVPLWFLAQMSRKDVTVLLSGEGADELFAGYLTYRADRYSAFARLTPVCLRKMALSCARLLPVSDDKIGFEYKAKRFLQGSLLTPDLAHVFWNGTFCESGKRTVLLHPDSRPLAAILESQSPGSLLQRALAFDQRYYLPDDILHKVDRISMAHSLEVRPPFLDPRVVNFANSLPDNLKLRGFESKYVLRRLMKDKLPSCTLRRPKVGFDIPIHDWFRGVLKPLLLDTLSEEAVSATNLFRWPAIERLLREHMERRENWGYHLWGLMVLMIWIKRWRIEVPSPAVSFARTVIEMPEAIGSLL
ncbi:MAG: asparagine synthase (glutamine-hydrolyzing) [Acidobacteriota bacterium]|nr:asparagine synthase (glutamine-hydrolyzing) [Acidobacteriota bacterium]